MKNKIFLKCAITLSAAFVSQSSFAFIVFDPTNWVQNYASAIAAVKNEINTDMQYITQLQQLRTQLQNLNSMSAVGSAARLAGVQSELNTIMQVKNATQNLYTSLQNGSNYVQGIQKMINVSGTTPQAWLAREQNLVSQKDGNATNLMLTGQAVINAVTQAQQQRDQILSDNDINEGIRGTAMKTNALLGNLASVNSATLMMMKAQSDAHAQEITIQNHEAEQKSNDAANWINNRIRIQEQINPN